MFAATRSRCGGLALLVVLLCASAAAPASGAVPGGYDVERVDALASAAPASGAVPGGYDVERVDALAAAENLNVGGRVANVGDIDRDGKDDLALGVPAADGGQGKVVVVSGADGTSIYAVSNPFEAANTGDPARFGGAVAVLGDILRCAGAPAAGANCDNKVMSGDSVPEFLVGAVGGDVNSGLGADQGRVYVIDGATGAIANRVIPPSDDLPSSGKAEFGTSALSLGDTDGDDRADFAVGAPGHTEADSRYCELLQCHQAGRVYVYSGAELARGATSALEAPALTVDNPYAAADTASQRFGHSLASLADIGRCATPGGDRVCPDPTNDPDGTPEFLATVPLLDQPAGADAGAAVVIDGATGLVLEKVDAVDAQANGRFGLFSYSAPAVGNMGGGASADLLVGAPDHGSGRAFVIDGTLAGSTSLGPLPDPAPVDGGGFGAAAGGLDAGGVVVGTPNASPATVHLFDNDRAAAQTICDPDNQPGSQFGASVTSLGDANGDGFDELAVGAPGFDRAGVSNAGRVYLFASRAGAADGPGKCALTGGGSGSGGGGSGGSSGTKATPPKSGTVVIARVLRRLVLKPNRKRVRKNGFFRLRGTLKASANRSACQNRQKIALQRRVKGRRFQTFEVAVTRASGAFTAKALAQRTYVYRARVSQTARCMGAVSKTARVSVLRKRGSR